MSKNKKVDPKAPVTADVEEEEVGPDPAVVSLLLWNFNDNTRKMDTLRWVKQVSDQRNNEPTPTQEPTE